VKKAARVLVEKYYTRLTHDFQTNKKIAEDVAIIPSKRLRNKIAGFATVSRICLDFSIQPSQFSLLNSFFSIPPSQFFPLNSSCGAPLCVCERERESKEQRRE
jgi:ribosomal protein S17E